MKLDLKTKKKNTIPQITKCQRNNTLLVLQRLLPPLLITFSANNKWC